MDEHYCLYALTWAACPKDSFGPGVDPRFPVELVRYGRLAALTSRVGLDQFDLAKLQEGTADFLWLSEVAVRHNEIITAVARHLPVLPMRLGIFFASRPSLIAKLAPHEANTVEFLRRLEDRQEWAVKIYIDEERAEKASALGSMLPGRRRGAEVRHAIPACQRTSDRAPPAGPSRGPAGGLDRRGPFAGHYRLLASASSAADFSHQPAGEDGMERGLPALKIHDTCISRGVRATQRRTGPHGPDRRTDGTMAAVPFLPFFRAPG